MLKNGKSKERKKNSTQNCKAMPKEVSGMSSRYDSERSRPAMSGILISSIVYVNISQNNRAQNCNKH